MSGDWDMYFPAVGGAEAQFHAPRIAGRNRTQVDRGGLRQWASARRACPSRITHRSTVTVGGW